MALVCKKIIILGILSALGVCVLTLNNGLAITPPMGWMHWQRFRCTTNCTEWPGECVNEQLFRDMADRMAEDGYRDAGYEYVSIDDCWTHKHRAENGSLIADLDRFPSGIKALADYVHSKGLKLGIYADFGHLTCGGYPGSEFYMQMDADTFAAWGVDMLKLDGCYSEKSDMEIGYPVMGQFLNRTGRPILYSCSWPAYTGSGKTTNYTKIAETCNMWRNYRDIQDSWDVMYDIIQFYGKNPDNFSSFAGSGNWNDPDELIIGDFALSYTQQKVQMGMWAMMASPLFMSVDLRNIASESRALLLNKRLLAINQDPLRIQGIQLTLKGIQIWRREISGGIALAFVNGNTGGVRKGVRFTLADLGLTEDKYQLTEVFEGKNLGVKTSDEQLRVNVDNTGIYMMVAAQLSKQGQ